MPRSFWAYWWCVVVRAVKHTGDLVGMPSKRSVFGFIGTSIALTIAFALLGDTVKEKIVLACIGAVAAAGVFCLVVLWHLPQEPWRMEQEQVKAHEAELTEERAKACRLAEKLEGIEEAPASLNNITEALRLLAHKGRATPQPNFPQWEMVAKRFLQMALVKSCVLSFEEVGRNGSSDFIERRERITRMLMNWETILMEQHVNPNCKDASVKAFVKAEHL